MALLLAERASIPAVLLSPQGEVLLITPAAERVFGSSYDSVGSNWIERYAASTAASAARWFLDRTLAGALRRFEVELVTAQGPAMASFESCAVGNDDGRGVLLLLEKLVLTSRSAPATDYDYEVRESVSGGFALGSLWALGSERGPESGKCYEVLHARDSPCEPCPLRTAEPHVLPQAVVRARANVGEYELRTATPMGDGSARVSVRHLSMASFSTILHAKLDELSTRAQLSKRERDVLAQLIFGHPLEEIASSLEITQRTVKFHQTNLLQKLGADSRSDLMRLVFWR